MCRWCHPKKVCSICQILRDRQYYTEREWFRIKADTLDAKCLLCVPMPRCDNGFQRCRKCSQERSTAEFGRWTIAHGPSHKNQWCDACMVEEESQKQDLRRRNKSQVQVSHDGTSAVQHEMNPKVSIFCPDCDAEQCIDMNILWKRGDASHRFVKWSCLTQTCKNKKKET